MMSSRGLTILTIKKVCMQGSDMDKSDVVERSSWDVRGMRMEVVD